MLFSGKENVFRLFGCLGIRFTENQFRCLVRSNILRKMLSVLRKIKLCNQNRKNKRRENLINHSTASNGKVRVIQFNPIPHSHFPTNQTDPQKKQNPEKKNSSNPVKLREEGRERGDWVRSRGEIARRRRRRDHTAEAKERSRGRGEIERRWSRSLLDWCGAIGTVLRLTRLVRSARCCD